MKFIKWAFLFLIFILAGLNLYILISGNTFIYGALGKTYFSGQNGPGIYDLEKFSHRQVKSLHPQTPITQVTGEKVINEENQTYLDSIETTSFIVLQNDTLKVEKYFQNHEPSTLSNSFSVAKTIIALLVGMAVQEGHIKSLSDPVQNYLPEFSGKGREKIRIRDLMAMSSGLKWHESGKSPFSDNAEAYYGSDLNKLILTTMYPEKEPGKHFEYKSGNTQLLAMVLEKAVKKSVAQYASEKLWTPLHAENNAEWSIDRVNGIEKAYCCFYATSRDFAKLGQMVLNKGRVGETQILDSAFIDYSLTLPQNLDEKKPNQRYSQGSWWVVNFEEETYFYARGILGQYIIISEKDKMVIVRTGKKRDEVDESGHPKDVYRYIKIAKELIK